MSWHTPLTVLFVRSYTPLSILEFFDHFFFDDFIFIAVFVRYGGRFIKILPAD